MERPAVDYDQRPQRIGSPKRDCPQPRKGEGGKVRAVRPENSVLYRDGLKPVGDQREPCDETKGATLAHFGWLAENRATGEREDPALAA